MNRMENKFKEKIYKMISLVKLLTLLVCGIIVLMQYSILYVQERNEFSEMIIVSIITGIGVLMLTYKAWVFSNNDKKNLKIGISHIMEILLFIVIFSILIVVSGGYTSQYKFIFLFTIIPTTMQFGMKYGMGVAYISSIIVLFIDYIGLSNKVVNLFFETDLILAGVFLLTAWLLGSYVTIEEEYRNEMNKLVNVDELTQIYNHRCFQESLLKAVEKAKKHNSPVSLLFIDIDYFKHYNDLYGHQAGDKVLERIGQILKNAARENDFVARYGGEEFAIILPNTLENKALVIAEGIRRNIEKAEFKGQCNLPNKNLTVSIGISCFPDKAKTKEELINSSDDALYRAKFFNKNRVEIYFSVLEELKNDIQEEHIDLITSIKTLISVINAKDRYTYGHTERVVIYCKMIGEKLGLSKEDQKLLRYGAYLHDIGKIEVGREILNKKMALTDKEWNILKKHPENGAEIIKPVDSLKKVVPLILYHHERYDGKGYPMKLKGENIPYLARILTVVDSFDAMTSKRPYQSAKSYEEAILELEICSATQFDPHIVKEFIEVIRKE
ncbi:MAG: diguanylate cyclase [Marinisporobacter sp.]|nr:diguanylate cyclase [Marinisporobacter sp.]